MRFLLAFLTIAILLSSCKKEDNIIESFDALSNYPQTDTVKVDMLLENAVFQGIVLPAKEQYFVFDAKIHNPKNKQLYYKIYYQNESYKFHEDRIEASENFYGSWQETQIGFKPFSGEQIIDSFQIVGNPRNEVKYFGKKTPRQLTKEDIEEGIKIVKENKEWYESIKQKAKANKVPLKEQMILDIIWVINHENSKQGEINRRERRNPRTGVYEFLLVVADEEGLKLIPEHIKDISKHNPETQNFENPFSYFKNNNPKGVYILKSQKVLKTRAVLNAKQGVYVNPYNCPASDFQVYSHDTSLIGNTESLYHNALFEQYFHDINKNRVVEQIPVLANMLSEGEYTIKDYAKAKEKFADKQSRIKIYPNNTAKPGMNIYIPQDRSYIGISNPANKEIASAKKENVGIKSRIGFSYGKYRGKIKFPPLVNPDEVWTGLTNAFWLAYQSESDWNKRRACEGKGYVKHSKNDNESERESATHYSEIDIEMIKTSKYWTEEELQKDNPIGNGKFVLACTNWDMACPQPLHFNKGGIQTINYKDNTFNLHRWTQTYRALTSRVELDNSVFDNDFYYFEIEWKPTEIIWRVGKDENNMKVVGYMNESVTSIPNNQMLSIVTQEFHYSDWWLPEVFEQGLIPFNTQAFEGKIFEIVIE
jgi:hypothetical protein